MAEVTELKPSKPGNDGDTTDQNGVDQTTPATAPQKSKGGRPPNGARRPPEARQPAFFDKVASVPREDWGTRAFMYVYVDEPACNPKTFGESRYLLKSSAPILDLEGLKQDYGSFKGWMSLNLRKTGKDATDEVDRLNFEIYDPKYPPKIPRGAWANDARNKRWLDLLPAEAPPASAAASSLLEGARFYKDIREELKEEMTPNEPQQTRTNEVLETMKAAKDLFAPPATVPATTPAKDPLEIATALFTIMNQTKADNPAIDMYRDELKAARDEMKEMRAAALAQVATPAEKPKTLIEQLTDFKALKDVFSNGTVAETVRAGRPGALDVIRDLGSKFFESDLASGVGQYLASLATRNVSGNGAPPQMSNPGNAMQPAQTEQQQFAQFIETTLNPALRRFYSQGMAGSDFAGWLYDAFPERLTQLQNFTHPLAPGMKGASVIVAAYKRTPEMWNLIQAQREGEPSFVQFVSEFCRWKPEDSEHDGVIDAEIVPEGDSDEERIS